MGEFGELGGFSVILGSDNNAGKFATLASHLPGCKGNCIVFRGILGFCPYFFFKSNNMSLF